MQDVQGGGMSSTPSGGRHPESLPTGRDETVDWSVAPDGGFAEFRASRMRLLESLRRDSEIHRLEETWALAPAPERA